MIRKHIHKHPCIVCSSAAAVKATSSSSRLTPPPSAKHSPIPSTTPQPKPIAPDPTPKPIATANNTTPRRGQQQQKKRNSSVATSLFPNDKASQSMVSDEGLTSLQLRERDFQTYLDLFVNNANNTTTSPASSSTSTSGGGKPFYPDASLWGRFTGGDALSLEEYDTLAEGMVDSCVATSTSTTTNNIGHGASHNSILDPTTSASLQSKRRNEVEEDVITIDVSIPKQQQFFTCLSEFDALMREAGVSYFLCCGTALGMIRESRFIPHDNDIDVGIMFIDETSASPKPCEITQEGILILLGHLHTSSSFVCIDCIGEVDKGLEIRLQHQGTGVLLDVNLYYHSSTSEDGSGAPFVWCATHYAESASRKHGMYRYKHTPFLDELTSVSIVGASINNNNGTANNTTTISANLPPTTYLEEYFGSDWIVPKKYSYEEGLSGEYKNIIQE